MMCPGSVSRPVRVFHLIKSLGRGGAEQLLSEGLRVADRAQFDFRFGYFLPWKDAMVPALERQGADVTCFGAPNNLRIMLQAGRIATALRRQRIDVLHCHLPVAGAVGRIAGRLAGVPVVYSEHNKQERYHRWTRMLSTRTWRWQSRVIAVSSDVADSIHANIGSDVRVDIVRNGVDVGHFSRAETCPGVVRRQLGIPSEAPVVGLVAVFRTQKRLQDWLEAARLLRVRHPDVRFLMVGDGPLRGEVAAAIAAGGLADAVHLPGLQEDVRPYLAAMDIYMISSLFEGLPVALLEAMAMECGVVATEVGGIPEAIHSGENGVLVPPLQPAALAAAASDLLANRSLLARYGRAARATVEAEFSMRRMARQLERIYMEVVEPRP
jgi:glycosyltransferase involved in cell wall biosynthesis